MSNISLFENNISFTADSEVRQLCAPLFKHFPINYVGYFRVYDDGSYFGLSSDSAWAKQFYKKQYPGPGYTGIDFSSGLYLGSVEAQMKVLNPSDEALRDILEFGLHDSAWIMDKQEDYYDMFGFAVPYGCKNMNNFYVNHLDILERFIKYFKQEGSDLIERADADRVNMPDKFSDSFYVAESESYDFMQAKKKFLREISSVKLKQPLSNREMQCLQQVNLGKTAREAAEQLGLSMRTVETYLDSVKRKLGCRKRSQIIEIARDLGLLS